MPAKDRFGTFTPDLIQPIRAAKAVTPSDSADLAEVTRAIWVGTVGNLNVDLADGGTIVLTAPTLGVIHWLRVKRVRATSTTAGAIVALY